MANTSEIERPVRPSVLDRLIDDDPKSNVEPPLTRSQSVRQFKTALRRDLEWLLNARRVITPVPDECVELARSVQAILLRVERTRPQRCGSHAGEKQQATVRAHQKGSLSASLYCARPLRTFGLNRACSALACGAIPSRLGARLPRERFCTGLGDVLGNAVASLA